MANITETLVNNTWCEELKEFGCRPDVQQRYVDQKYYATSKRRNIPWEFTYYTWCLKWFESGKWDERGKEALQYCMCRTGDVGPYSYENTRIDTNKSNGAESYANNSPVIPNKRKTLYNKVKNYYRYKGVLYTTIKQLADFNGVCSRTVNNWVSKGVVVRVEPPPKLKVVEKIVTPYGIFKNCTEASLAEPSHVRRQTVYHRLSNPNYPEYKKIKVVE